MRKAARAIIFDSDKLLVMHRNKEGEQYFTLVGGHVDEGETIEQAVVREVKEETGLDVIEQRHVFTEKHPEPYNDQYIFLCKIAPTTDEIAIQEFSEEAMLNKFVTNIHTPKWVYAKNLKSIPFRTPQLQNAIIDGIEKGFPETPINL